MGLTMFSVRLVNSITENATEKYKFTLMVVKLKLEYELIKIFYKLILELL